MPTPPLTHHEIISLIEPFARRGLRCDLARSDRLARRLVFEPRDRDDDPRGSSAHRETLTLDCAMPGRFRLIRTLTLANGLPATLWSEGDDPATTLERIETVPAALQLRAGSGFTMALDHRLDAAGTLHLVRVAALVDGVTVSLTMPTHRSRHADMAVATALDDPIEPPDDLLAVLGWAWSRLDRRLDRKVRCWTGSVRLRGGRSSRDGDAERKLQRAVQHVAATLSESPARFHARMRAARWGVAARRAIPLFVCVGLIGAALVFTKAGLSQDSVVRMLIFNAPPLLLVAFFCLREMPRIEWPRKPRPSRAIAWRAVGDDGTVVPHELAASRGASIDAPARSGLQVADPLDRLGMTR